MNNNKYIDPKYPKVHNQQITPKRYIEHQQHDRKVFQNFNGTPRNNSIPKKPQNRPMQPQYNNTSTYLTPNKMNYFKSSMNPPNYMKM